MELDKAMSSEHHLISDFHSKHMELHQKYPEKFHPENPNENRNENLAPSLPTYFGNVCLRFIPVFDIVVHRLVMLAIYLSQCNSFYSRKDALVSLNILPFQIFRTSTCIKISGNVD